MLLVSLSGAVRNVLIFTTSAMACLVVLVLERLIDIDWDFHPDVVTYTTGFKDIVDQGWSAAPNQLYYFVTALVDGSVAGLIAINIMAFCVTNLLVANYHIDFYRKVPAVTRFAYVGRCVFSLIVLFAPYRLHLAVHGLKDTLIILMLALLCASRNGFGMSIFSTIILMFLRVYSFFYAAVFLKGKYLYFAILASGVVVSVFNTDILALLVERNEADMHARDFDNIPSFADFGLLGTLIRMLVWPLLVLCGGFFIISPSPFFLPLAVELFASRMFARSFSKSFGVSIGLLLCLALIAGVINAFTAYLRYVYPILVMMPIVIMRHASLCARHKFGRKIGPGGL